ncbi:MAG: hypothetical protein FWG85_05470 [Bacteroidetes bacterium]|nr:hypothetical protein [Bacteroidota bacterium]
MKKYIVEPSYDKQEEMMEKLKNTTHRKYKTLHSMQNQIQLSHEMVGEFERDITELITKQKYEAAENMMDMLEKYNCFEGFFKNIY